MKFFNFRKEKLISILVNRTVIFFFLMCLFTLALYFAGTAQGFIDSTQFTLLKIYIVFSVFLTITAILGMIFDIGRFFSIKKSRYISRAGGYLFLIIFGALTVLAVIAIITISGGSIAESVIPGLDWAKL